MCPGDPKNLFWSHKPTSRRLIKVQEAQSWATLQSILLCIISLIHSPHPPPFKVIDITGNAIIIGLKALSGNLKYFHAWKQNVACCFQLICRPAASPQALPPPPEICSRTVREAAAAGGGNCQPPQKHFCGHKVGKICTHPPKVGKLVLKPGVSCSEQGEFDSCVGGKLCQVSYICSLVKNFT